MKALAEFNLNQKEEALKYLDTAIALEKTRDKKQELEGPNEDFDEIFNNIKKLHKQIKSK